MLPNAAQLECARGSVLHDQLLYFGAIVFSLHVFQLKAKHHSPDLEPAQRAFFPRNGCFVSNRILSSRLRANTSLQLMNWFSPTRS